MIPLPMCTTSTIATPRAPSIVRIRKPMSVFERPNLQYKQLYVDTRKCHCLLT